MIVGCYTLHLYCRHAGGKSDNRHLYGLSPAEFTGRTYSECRRTAMKHGWRFHRAKGTPGDDDVTCPWCVRFGPGVDRLPEQEERGVPIAPLVGLAALAHADEDEK